VGASSTSGTNSATRDMKKKTKKMKTRKKTKRDKHGRVEAAGKELGSLVGAK
jgi:hypothetical protein